MSLNTILATTPLTTTNFHLKATGTTIGNSLIWDNGTNVGIGNTNTSYTLDVSGTGRFTGALSGTSSFFTSNIETQGRLIIQTATSPTAQGQIGYGSDAGLYIWPKSGTTYAYTLYSNTGNEVMRIPTGTTIANFVGSIGIGTINTNTKLNIQNDGVSVYSNAGWKNTSSTAELYVGVGGSSVGATFIQNNAYIMNAGASALILGTSDTERMRITSGGIVQITNSSDAQLSLAASGSTAYVRFANSAGDVWGIGNSFSAANTDFQLYNFTTAAYGFRVSRGGIYANTTGIAANVQIDSNGYFARSTVSSLRYKENIQDWNGNGLDTILALKPKTFKYKKDYYNKADIDFLGLIAEDVAEISPYLADYENEDRTGQVENVRYAFIVVPLIKAIQEMNTKLDEQNQTIQNLQEQINILAK